MKKLMLSASALVALATAPSLASAQGWYGSLATNYALDGGVNFDAPANPTGGIASPYMIGNGAKGDGGWGGSAALGYGYDNGFRTEAELSSNSVNFKNEGVSSTLGSAQTYTAMLNGLYDFNRTGNISPYLGAGLGMARVKVKAMSADTANLSNPLLALNRASAAHVADTDTNFAWQLIAGLGLNLTEQLAVDLSYKWLNVPELEFAGTGRYRTSLAGTSASTPLTLGASVGGEGGSNGTFGLGLRYAFSKPVAAAPVITPLPAPPEPVVEPPVVTPPAPPAPPVATVCDGRSFVVYFQHDKSFLTDEASTVIDSQVSDIKTNSCNYRSAMIQGHADTSGNPRYNVGLSERRVRVVQDSLVAHGVPADIMTGEAYGESKPAVVTGDGVKEPLNRRTEVKFDFQ